jgi:hypothetical protein
MAPDNNWPPDCAPARVYFIGTEATGDTSHIRFVNYAPTPTKPKKKARAHRMDDAIRAYQRRDWGLR